MRGHAPAGEIEILLVDENRIFADVLALRLSEEPQVVSVTVAGSVDEAKAVMAETHADVLLVDYRTWGEGTFQLTSEQTRPEGGPAVIVLSGMSDTRTMVAALESGVRGWVTKESTFGTLWAAIREVMEGHMVLSPSVVEPILQRLLEALRQQEAAERDDFVADLSPREYEVLRCLVAGMDRQQIAARLYLSINTIRTHVRHLLRRADVHSTLALVAAARRLGVRGIDDPADGSAPAELRPR